MIKERNKAGGDIPNNRFTGQSVVGIERGGGGYWKLPAEQLRIESRSNSTNKQMNQMQAATLTSTISISDTTIPKWYEISGSNLTKNFQTDSRIMLIGQLHQ